MDNPLLALSPLDGRYADKVAHLAHYFSEYALIKYRLKIEIEWFIFLCNEAKIPELRILNGKEIKTLRTLHDDFDLMDAKRVKEFEKTTNHDVKALEYFIKEHLKAYPKLAELGEFIHFGCTSEDINNLAYSLMIKDFAEKQYMPVLTGVIEKIYELAVKHKNNAMLSRTHGQPASPTTLGKEMLNFVARLENLLEVKKHAQRFGKMNGAVGNFNAHVAAYQDKNWPELSKTFVEGLGLEWNGNTTQIEPHDMMALRFLITAQINTVLIDFARDMWTYISLGYFKQKLKEEEVGSSTMPHKVNPIDFENAEGNLGLTNALLRHFAEKLPVSRLQRDLSDSTVLRNIGVAFGYSILAYKSLLSGLLKLEVNHAALQKDLDENWEVLTEAIQTVLRKHKISGAYEKLKKLSRGKKLDQKTINDFVRQLKIPETEKKHLLQLTPSTYTGLAAKLVSTYLPRFRS